MVRYSDGPLFVGRAMLQGSPLKARFKSNAPDEPVDHSATVKVLAGPNNAKTLAAMKPGV